MRLHQIPDWPRAVESRTNTAVLASARRSPLGYFIILDIQDQGMSHLKLLEVGSAIIDKVLAVLSAHAGRPLAEISQLEIGD
jgi:hypothetical protein